MRKIWTGAAVLVTGLGLSLAILATGCSSGSKEDKMSTNKSDTGKSNTDKMGGDKMGGDKMGGDKMGDKK